MRRDVKSRTIELVSCETEKVNIEEGTLKVMRSRHVLFCIDCLFSHEGQWAALFN